MQLYGMQHLHDAVVRSYSVGETAIQGLVGEVFATTAQMQRTPAGLYRSSDGREWAITGGPGIYPAGSYQVAVQEFLRSEKPDAYLTENLRSPGRYEFVAAAAPTELAVALEVVARATADMLETLQSWIEDQIFLVVEDAASRLANGVYGLLNSVVGATGVRTRIDVAVVGQLAGWRVPNPSMLARTIGQLQRGPGRREADALAATFVSTTLPRNELLMSKALQAHQAIVVPFREAPYVIAGTYFGIACQLLDGETTQKIHPVYESPGLNVLLIYPANDEACGRVVEERVDEIERHVASNLDVYKVALEEIEGTLSPTSMPTSKRSLMTILDEATGRIEPAQVLPPPDHDRRRGRHRGDQRT